MPIGRTGRTQRAGPRRANPNASARKSECASLLRTIITSVPRVSLRLHFFLLDFYTRPRLPCNLPLQVKILVLQQPPQGYFKIFQWPMRCLHMIRIPFDSLNFFFAQAKFECLRCYHHGKLEKRNRKNEASTTRLLSPALLVAALFTSSDSR